MEKLKRTLKERKFIAAYIENNGNASKAYRVTHPKYKGENSHVLGCRTLIKVNITTNELLDEMGMNDEQLHGILLKGLEAKKTIPTKKELIDVDDFPTRHKYLDTAYKLKGTYPAEKHDIEERKTIVLKRKNKGLQKAYYKKDKTVVYIRANCTTRTIETLEEWFDYLEEEK